MRWQGMGESVWLRGGKRELESWKYKTGRSVGKRESLEGLICCEWEDGPKTEKPSEGSQANEG